MTNQTQQKTKREYQLLIEVAKSRILGTATE